MKKQLITIISLVVVLALVGTAYFFMPSKEDKDKNSSEDKINLLNIDTNKLSKIQYINGEENFTLIKNKEVKENDEEVKDKSEEAKVLWSAEGSKESVKQEMINERLNIFGTLKAEQKVTENAENLKQYGLDNSSKKIILTLEDNSTKELIVGAKVPTGYDVYCKLGDSNTIYTVNETTIDQLYLTLEDVIQIKLPTADIVWDSVRNISITPKGEKEIALNKSDDKWYVVSPYSKRIFANNSKIESILSTVISLSAKESFDITDKSLSEVGLDNPAYVISVIDSSKEYKIKFSEDKNGKSYFNVEGTDKIYATSSSILASYKINAYDFVDVNMFAINDTEVSKIIINSSEYGDKTWTIEENKDEKKDGVEAELQGNNSSKYIYKLNDEEKDEVYFKTFYDLLKKLTIEGELKEKVADSEPVITIDLQGKYKVDAKFYNYDKDKDFYVLELNGNKNFLIEKKFVDEAVKMLK